jgi:hypothetical protein
MYQANRPWRQDRVAILISDKKRLQTKISQKRQMSLDINKGKNLSMGITIVNIQTKRWCNQFHYSNTSGLISTGRPQHNCESFKYTLYNQYLGYPGQKIKKKGS